ncbi:hypothetical protein SRL2020411_50500 [Mycobacterium kiyosense]|nr:hypothetical protein SRL2020411_50500 [Mycobacterium kiyosense]
MAGLGVVDHGDGVGGDEDQYRGAGVGAADAVLIGAGGNGGNPGLPNGEILGVPGAPGAAGALFGLSGFAGTL